MIKKRTNHLHTDFRQDFDEFINEFNDETDRAVVILGAAKLDILLYQLLIKVLLPNVGSSDELFDGDSPLSTFNAKINLCFRLGLIDSSLARALHLVRKIRNSVAHEITGRNLDEGAHKDRIRELVSPLVEFEQFSRMVERFSTDRSVVGNNFRAMLAILMARLHRAISDSNQLSEFKPVSLIPSSFMEKKNQIEKIDTAE